jgi:hypothetical protein
MRDRKHYAVALTLVVVAAALLSLTWFGCSEDSTTAPPNPPALVVSPSLLALTSPNVSTDFEIWNGGQGTLEWTAVSNQSWCVISSGSGTSTGSNDPTTITVTVDYSGFDPGDTKLAEIKITSNGGNGNVNVSTTLPSGPCSIRVTGPVTSEVWSEGLSGVIKWTSENTGGSVRIELYKAGVHQCQITPSTSDIGLYDWTVDACGGGSASDYRVRVYEAGYAECWASSGDFEITSTQPDAVASVNPKTFGFNSDTDPGPKTLEIWNSGSGTLDWTASVPTKYQNWLSVAPQAGSSTGERDAITVTIDWSVFNPDGEVKDGGIEIASNGGGGVITVQATQAEPPPCTISIARPAEGADWTKGQLEEINWTSANTSGNVEIELYKNGVSLCEITSSTADNGQFSWTVDDCGGGTGSDYTIEIKDVVGIPPCKAETDTFTITIPPPTPVINVTPTTLDFTYAENNKTIEIQNVGTGSLIWTASETLDWLSLVPNSGENTGETDVVTVTIDWAMFQNNDTKNGTISITSNGGNRDVTVVARRL